jgi:hypothetical protein
MPLSFRSPGDEEVRAENVFLRNILSQVHSLTGRHIGRLGSEYEASELESGPCKVRITPFPFPGDPTHREKPYVEGWVEINGQMITPVVTRVVETLESNLLRHTVQMEEARTEVAMKLLLLLAERFSDLRK